MNISKVIEQLGYTSHEAKVYLASVKLGDSTATSIAASVDLPRSSVQNILEHLHKRGIMSFYDKKRYRYWIAENPERLMISLREKEGLLKTAIPQIASLRHPETGKPTVKVFKGADEIKFIHEDLILSHHPIKAIVSWDEWVDLLGSEHMRDTISKRAGNFQRIRLITSKTTRSMRLKSLDEKEMRHTKFMPQHLHISTSNFIYGNKVAIVSLNKKEPTAVLIEDPDIAHTMSVFFDDTWNQSSEF